MFDTRLRAALDSTLVSLSARLVPRRVRAVHITIAGLVLGIGACVAVAWDRRWIALALWLANRFADGLDGAVARTRETDDRGGFVDLIADFSVYAGFVIGVAYARPDARLAAVVLLGAYYVSGAAFLAWSSLAERRALVAADNRSLHFVGGIAEGAETIVVYVALCLWPSATEPILWVFAGAVGVTAVQRVVFAWRSLSETIAAPDR